MPTLPIPHPFGPGQTAAWIASWSASADVDDLRLRLEGEARLQPAGIVLLASGIARRQSEGRRTWLTADGSAGDAIRDLEGLDFLRELGVETDAAEASRALETGVVPLRRLADLRAVRQLADRTRDFLESRFPGLSPTTLRAAHFVFEELGANVVQHSGRPDTGFGLASADPRTGRIQIAFADSGVGFRASLERNPELAGRIEDDGQAIQLALDRRITSGGPGNLGIGLSFLGSLAERLGGDLWLASGTALFRQRSAAAGARVANITTTAGWRGAWLCLDAPVPGA
jgi:anti-sigma regulatory factor (Ser/Thr protein kinase)